MRINNPSVPGAGTVNTAAIQNAAVTLPKLANLTAQSVIGNPTNAAAPPTVIQNRHTAQFTSAAQVITSGGQLVLAHGMPRQPIHLQILLTCINVAGDAGWANGDFIFIDHSLMNAGATLTGVAVQSDVTNLTVRFSNAVSVFEYKHKTTGAAVSLDNASWNMYLLCWA